MGKNFVAENFFWGKIFFFGKFFFENFFLKNFFEKKFEKKFLEKKFWEKNCDLHITLARVHSVQIFKSFRLLHHSVIMLYDTKNDEKTTKSQKKGSGYYCTAWTRFL